MNFIHIKDYLKKVIANRELISRINVLPSSSGFYCRWTKGDGHFIYIVHIPEDNKSLNFLTELTLRHEVGHILFNEMFYNNHNKLTSIMDRILQNRIFYFLQGAWYWNPLIRKIKKKFNFSIDLDYNSNELYDKNKSNIYTRRDNELFCDYFALFVKKDVNFSLVV